MLSFETNLKVPTDILSAQAGAFAKLFSKALQLSAWRRSAITLSKRQWQICWAIVNIAMVVSNKASGEPDSFLRYCHTLEERIHFRPHIRFLTRHSL
jgi:hypothetical protein